jgi:hypothetical protein
MRCSTADDPDRRGRVHPVADHRRDHRGAHRGRRGQPQAVSPGHCARPGITGRALIIETWPPYLHCGHPCGVKRVRHSPPWPSH